jgi:hypothetical protein
VGDRETWDRRGGESKSANYFLKRGRKKFIEWAAAGVDVV